MSNPQLSNYIRFFQILAELEQDCQITQKEKHHLKIGLTLKDYQLMNMIAINADADDEEFKYSIIAYLRNRNTTMQQRPAQKIRCKSTGITEMSPIRLMGRRNSQSKESKVSEELLVKQIEDLNESLLNILQTDSKQILNLMVSEKLRNICDLITKTANSTPIGSQKQFEQEASQQRIMDRILQTYKSMKRQYNDYMKCHLYLMDANFSQENLFKVIKIFIKKLVDADEFTFISVKDNIEFYSTSENHFSSQPLEQSILNELLLMQPNQLIELLEQNFYPSLSKLFKIHNFKRNYILKIQNQDLYLCFHQNQVDSVISQLLDLTNDYQFFEEVNQLALFLIETVKQARVQCFAPLQISHMIQDIGTAFIRCSKYLFIQKAIDILNEKYHIEKHFISDDMSMVSSPSIMHSTNFAQRSIEFDFKDQVGISVTIQGMDLSRKADLQVYKSLTQSFNKYLKFIKQCYDRTTYYKFFVKSQDSLIFEFDKKGQIVFISRPVPSNLQEQYNINFNPQLPDASYTNIFKNINLIKHIENYLQNENKWKLTESNASYEVFMKMEEKNFQGFFVIFQEGWLKYDQKQLQIIDPSIQNKVKKQLLQQETLSYLDKLEQNNPQIRNSVVQMFKPRQAQKSLFGQSNGSRSDSRNSILELAPKLQQFQIKSHCNSLAFEDLEETEIENINNFEFNLLPQSQNWRELQKVIFTICKINNFITDFKFNTSEFANFLSELEYKYNKNNNPFHNYAHGVAVMQCTHSISVELAKTKHKNLLTQFNKFALILSGLCHDVAHTGRTNIFEMNSLSKLAIRYHDKSVLEQHHAATAINMLCKVKTNFLVNFSNEEFRKFRKMFISNILYTDITEHFNLIKNFEERCVQLNYGETDDDIKLLTGMIIHTSDFNGGAKKFEISKQWSIRVNKEFEEQYDLEGKFGYPQLPYMKDLDKLPIMAKQESGFFKFIVRPLWFSLSKFMEDRLQESVDNLDDTIIQWEIIAQQEVK